MLRPSMSTMLTLILSGLLALSCSVWAQDNKADDDQAHGPKEAKTTAEIIKALQKIQKESLGTPNGVHAAEYRGGIGDEGAMRVFVAWHCPNSGYEACLGYLYVHDPEKEIWTRRMVKTFENTSGLLVEFGEQDGNKLILRDQNRKVVYTYAHLPIGVDPNPIKDKISLAPGAEFVIEFNRDGNRLTNPAKSKKAEVKTLSAKVKLGSTTASPIAPPRKGATRPFLSVENNLDKPLHFRVLVRMKGNPEYFELTEDRDPIPAGQFYLRCWDFDTLVEEVVLYDFGLTDDTEK